MPNRKRIIVVSNRGPLRSVKAGAKRRWERSAGGLVTALDPLLRDRPRSVWVSSQESEDDASIEVSVPDLGYRSEAVHLSRATQAGFYEGVSNAVLWPVMHSFQPTIRIGEAPWAQYVAANRAFAEVVLETARDDDLVWVHDYHLMLLPGMLRAARPHLRIGWFCHIPWPSADLFSVIPWRRQILEGLLGADLIGLHTGAYVDNLLACVARLTDREIVDGTATSRSTPAHATRVVAAPIGIPVEEHESIAADPTVVQQSHELRRSVGHRRILLGVDRLDYTKGIPERLLAYERLLRRERLARSRCVFVQIMVPSRTDVEAYASLKQEVDRLVGSINGRYGTTGQVPIHYIYRNLDRPTLFAHYRAADVALVTPLRDGMNLVALEYVASRFDDTGALVLSEFAGAAGYLKDALIVNPHDVAGFGDVIETALSLDLEGQARRMVPLRAAVRSLDVHRWADGYLRQLES